MFLAQEKETCYTPLNEVKNFNCIDLLKFLCAILVFTIHISPFQGETSEFARYVCFGLQHCVCRVAVPFYFASSGFFLFKKMSFYKLDKEIIKTYCFKILRLLGIWHILLFSRETGHLWYLGSTVVAIIIISLCSHFRIKSGYIYAIACILYVVGLLGDSYHGIIAPLENIGVFNLLFKGFELAFSTTRNGIFMGFIFVLIGATFANHKIALKKRTALIGFAASMLCLLAEVFILKYNDIPTEYNMYVFLPPATFFLFSLATSVTLKDHSVYKHLRKIGTIVYFSHLLVHDFASLAVSMINKHFGIELIKYQFLLSLIFTLLIAIFIDWLSYKDKFKWVNWLIS